MFQQCLNCEENNFASFIFAVWLSSVQSSVFTLRPSPRSARNVPKAWASLHRLEICRPIHTLNPKTVGDWISKLSWFVPAPFYLVIVLFFLSLVLCWSSVDDAQNIQKNACWAWACVYFSSDVLFVIWRVRLATVFTGICHSFTGRFCLSFDECS